MGRRSMGEGTLLGASRGFGRNPGWKGCSLVCCSESGSLFIHASEKPVAILTFIYL